MYLKFGFLRQHLEEFHSQPTENSFVNYYALDHVFKMTSNKDYYALPSHTNQHIMKEVFEAWKSFFNSVKDYSKHPEKYTGRPNLPRYAKKGGYKTITFTNQTCVIKDDKYLKFPKTRQTSNIGKLGMVGKLKEVKVIPLAVDFLPCCLQSTRPC